MSTFQKDACLRREQDGMISTMVSKKDQYIVVTKNFVVSDRPGRKYMQKMLNDGYEIVSETKTSFSRATTVTFRKPNPKYQG